MLETAAVFFASLLPRKVQAGFLRALGHDVEDGAHIAPGAIVRAKKIRMRAGAQIGSFSVVICDEIDMDVDARVRPLSLVKCQTVTLGRFAHVAPLAVINADVAPGATFHLGAHSRVFPFCWIEPGEGVHIGDDSGIGGHTLIFTHGSWSDHLRGGPVAFAPVRIGNGVWLPWRVFVMPGTTIGDYAIIGANSVVTTQIEAGSLAVGSPAKVVKRNLVRELTSEERESRARSIASSFDRKARRRRRVHVNDPSAARPGDILFLTEATDQACVETYARSGAIVVDYAAKRYLVTSANRDEEFSDFLRMHGIRLETVEL